MRSYYRQYPFFFLMVVIVACFVLIRDLSTLRSSLSVKNVEIHQSETIKRSQLCEPCPSLSGIQPQVDTSFFENVVPVPISDFMSGKPYILPQNDKKIIDYIWSHGFMKKPSVKEYNLEYPNYDWSMGQGQFIRKLLKNMTNGFFVECGALDGETRSNTLFLEKYLNWNGLLVEADPSNYALLKQKNRKAYMSNTCLAINPYPHVAAFSQSFSVGKIESNDIDQSNLPGETSTKLVKVQCMPLFSLLSAINVTTVDYFSLDVEGAELQVLKTIPFDKVNIRTLSVEFSHTAEGKDELLTFMEAQGYRQVGEVLNELGYANDIMFAHKNLLENWFQQEAN